MREIRQSGSEGGARFYPSFLPLFQWAALQAAPQIRTLQEIEMSARSLGSVVSRLGSVGNEIVN